MKKHSIRSSVLPALLTILSVLPFLYIFVMSLRDMDGFTLKYYYQVFLAQSQFLRKFWVSLFISLAIAAGQLILSVLAGYGFAKCRFPGRDALFFALMVMMILPLQVILVPNYITLKAMELLDTCYALILPGIFVPLGTFIMTHSFAAVPQSVIEAARLDGCGTLGIILRVAAPMARSGLVITALLSFLDSWNMVEQPIVYLKDFLKYPLSVALTSPPAGGPTVQLVCCILTALPPVLLFAYYHRELVAGIAGERGEAS